MSPDSAAIARILRIVVLSAGSHFAVPVSAASVSIPAASVPAASASSGVPAEPRRLHIAVAGALPFVGRGEVPTTGLTMELWQDVAQQARIEYQLTRVAHVEEALRGVEQQLFDVAVGPISITSERARTVHFTQPYFEAGLAIAGSAESQTFWSRARPFLSQAFIAGTATLLVILLIVGTAVWAAERKRNPEMFPKSPIAGIANGVWFALVTMTTVGYGDRVPLTVTGRVISGVWMILAMLSISSLTAGIATALTLSSLDKTNIESPDQLAGKVVAVVTGTIGESFARRHGAQLSRHPNVEQALASLEQGKADAAVHDRPALRYLLSEGEAPSVRLGPRSYEPLGYGFAVHDPELLTPLNVALLQLNERGVLEQTRSRWLGDEQ